MGRVACYTALVPGVSAHERACYSENILGPSHPPVVSAASVKRSGWESPATRQDNLWVEAGTVVKVNIVALVEKG